MVRQATTTIDVKKFNFFAFDEDSDAAIEEKDSDESDDSDDSDDDSSSFESNASVSKEPEKPVEEPLSPAAIKR